MKVLHIIPTILMILAGLSSQTHAEVKPAPLFTDNMVVQRDMKTPVSAASNDHFPTFPEPGKPTLPDVRKEGAGKPHSSFEFPEMYNVVWTEFITNTKTAGIMPCGGGDTGLNVSVENGEVGFFICRSGSFDESGTMVKLGRVRVKVDPNPFEDDTDFRQELKLKEGYVEIQGKKGELDVLVRIWVEVFRPVIHVDCESSQPVNINVAVDGWRLKKKNIPTKSRMQCYSWQATTAENFPVYVYPDIYEPGEESMAWYHRNRNDDLSFDKEMIIQRLGDYRHKLWNLQKDLTFGCMLRGKSLKYTGESVFTPFVSSQTLATVRIEAASEGMA